MIVRYSRRLELVDILDSDGRLTDLGRDRLPRLISPVGSVVFVDGDPDPRFQYDNMRREMFMGSDVCIAVGGDYASIEVPHNRGMMFEKALAQKDHTPYIPVPFVSGFSRECHPAEHGVAGRVTG